MMKKKNQSPWTPSEPPIDVQRTPKDSTVRRTRSSSAAPAISVNLSTLSDGEEEPISQVQSDVQRFRRFWIDPPSYATLKDSHKSTRGHVTAREYRRRWQRTRILLNSSYRLALTITLCISCAITLWQYQKKGDLTTTEIRLLNAFVTALPLFVALNFRSSLQSYIKILRWWILARWDWPVRQFDLILNIASSKAVFHLMWESRKRRVLSLNKTQWACLAWLLSNVAGSVGIALLSLAYNLDPSDGAVTRKGLVSTMHLDSQAAEVALANIYYYRAAASPTTTYVDVTTNKRRDYKGLSITSPEPLCDCSRWEYILTQSSSDVILLLEWNDLLPATVFVRCRSYSVVNWTNSTVTYVGD
jgi:hypothetical protein